MTSQEAAIRRQIQQSKSQRVINTIPMKELGSTVRVMEEIHQEGVALDTIPMANYDLWPVTEARGMRVILVLPTASSKVTPETVTNLS